MYECMCASIHLTMLCSEDSFSCKVTLVASSEHPTVCTSSCTYVHTYMYTCMYLLVRTYTQYVNMQVASISRHTGSTFGGANTYVCWKTELFQHLM